ncbi:MAG: hypothetical protein RTU92_02725 [Candidatus Thorarchaeota archaeon]
MSKEKKSKGPQKYEDFISAAPDTIHLYTSDDKVLVDEYGVIIGALIGKTLTVKEIHRLYLEDPEGPVYSKTLKTVYRHLDALEKVGLIKVAGYRKYEGSRQTEKLYCRSAKVYFPVETTETKWWESNEGRELVEKIVKVAVEFYQLPSADPQQMIKMLAEHYGAWGQIVRRLFEETAENEKLADIFSDVEMHEIKDVARMIGTFGIILNHSEIIERMRNWLSK